MYRPIRLSEDSREVDDDNDAMEFVLRNYGPGPALYLQAVVTVETQQEQTEVVRFQVHDRPLHLQEGDFVSLVLSAEDDWVNEMADKYEISQSENEDGGRHENPPMVNLYYSYVSQSGAREPTWKSTERDDTDVLDDIKNPERDARHIELWRVADAR